MTLTDVADWYLDAQGNLSRWMRGGSSGPTAPGAPTNAQVTLSSGTATVTWAPPSKDGGSAITGYTVTREGGATHTKLSTDRTDTFTGLGAGPYSFDIAAVNIVGPGPIAVANTASTAARFPGDTLPLKTGNILTGATETDSDGLNIKANWEWYAPEADTGVRYGIVKEFFSSTSVENCFLPNTSNNATIAAAVKKHYAKGRMVLANVAIQQSTSTHFTTWRDAADLTDTVVHDAYYNFIQWCEEGSDVPDCPIWLCMPHEAQQGNGTTDIKKFIVDPTRKMTPGDFGDLQWAFRTCMDQYALSKTGGTDPTVYKWKRLAFGGIHVGDVFGLPNTNPRHIDGFYTSYKNGGTALAHRVHDFVGGDPYQTPIGTPFPAPGRTGTPGWSTAMQGMVTWCKAKGYPIVFGEYGVHNTDGDAGFQLEAWWNKVTGGTYDIVAVIYWNSAPDGPPLDPNGNGHGRFMFTDYQANDPSLGSNGGSGHVGLYNFWKKIMTNTVPGNSAKAVHFWDVGSPGIPGGYPKPPGF